MTVKERLKAHNWDIKRAAFLEHDLLYSEAYNSLKPKTKDILIRFLQKREHFYEGKGKLKKRKYYDLKFVFTYQEAACFNISGSSFKIAIRELVKKGFLEIAYQGGTIGNGKDPSRYRLIDDWRYYGTDKFIPRIKEKAVQYSDGLDLYNEERKNQKALSAFSAVKNDHESWSNTTT
jgi:hypothetical protein